MHQDWRAGNVSTSGRWTLEYLRDPCSRTEQGDTVKGTSANFQSSVMHLNGPKAMFNYEAQGSSSICSGSRSMMGEQDLSQQRPMTYSYQTRTKNVRLTRDWIFHPYFRCKVRWTWIAEVFTMSVAFRRNSRVLINGCINLSLWFMNY